MNLGKAKNYIKNVTKKVFFFLCAILGNIIFLVPALICYKFKIKFITINEKRIGHLIGDYDSYLKESILNGCTYKVISLISKEKLCNKYVLEYYKDKITIINNKYLLLLLFPLSRHIICRVNSAEYTHPKKFSKFHYIEYTWAQRDPLHSFKSSDFLEGVRILTEIGMPSDAWFVCIHSRESGYSGANDFDQEFRNSKIETFDLAIKEVVERGGWCIRMGDSTMSPIAHRKQLIDYANHPAKSDFMDIFLAAHAKLFIGNTSGAYLMAHMFGVPIAGVNMTPLSTAPICGLKDMAIPKLYADREGNLIKFSQLKRDLLLNARVGSEFKKMGVSIIDNSPEDIRDIVSEQLDRIKGDWVFTEEDKILQNRFKSLLTPDDYSYYSPSLVGTKFLKKYSHLLEN